MSKMYLGVDIGGTAVKLGLVDENGQVVSRAERSVSFDGYKTPILDTVTAAIRDFIAPHDAPALAGIGVSATGQIDSFFGRPVLPRPRRSTDKPSGPSSK